MRRFIHYLSDVDVWLPWRIRGGYTFPHLVVIAVLVLSLTLANTLHTTRPGYFCHKATLPHSFNVGTAHPMVLACSSHGTNYVVVVIEAKHHHKRKVR